jgi:predicted RNase H-like HicB family nuclease
MVGTRRSTSQVSQGAEANGLRREFTAILEQDDGWIVGYCPEIPGANGQGRTKQEALDGLAAAIELILEDRREDGRGRAPRPSRRAKPASRR